ncbi:MAG: efflux RND transporter periplasmic adaptor subunit [Pseudolabrys sp.]
MGEPRMFPGHWRVAAAVVMALAALAGCEQKNTYVAPPPPKVTVAKPAQRSVTLYLQATGNAAAVNTADLVARVNGFVHSIDYKDGDFVKKDKLLFTIEPKPYDLKLEQSKAAQDGAQATLVKAEAEYKRQVDLAKTGTNTQVSLDNARAARDSAKADLEQAKVNTRLAAINVDYAHVSAPFDGIVTARQVSIGDYVGGGATPTTLASIVELNPIYVNFNITEKDVLRIRAEIRKLGLTQKELKKVPVEVGLQTEQGYPHKGTLDYASPTVDASTGTLAARAILKNPKRVLLPGMFVRVRVPTGKLDKALLVPETALGTDQSGRYLMIVGKDDVVKQRTVTVGPRDGTMRVIEKGLKPDDRVIVAGLMRAVPGQKVAPQTEKAAPAKPASSPGKG